MFSLINKVTTYLNVFWPIKEHWIQGFMLTNLIITYKYHIYSLPKLNIFKLVISTSKFTSGWNDGSLLFLILQPHFVSWTSNIQDYPNEYMIASWSSRFIPKTNIDIAHCRQATIPKLKDIVQINYNLND
jgi:hypothetical protein